MLRERDQAHYYGIDLLKVIAILLIVISHTVNSLDFIDVNICSRATTNAEHLTLSLLRYCGPLGNDIFFVCSAWFLIDSSKVNKRKIVQLLMDIWVISISILVAVYILRGGDIGAKMIISSIFPTTFANNWYMTCYLLFYPIHPFLNVVIKSTKKEVLLKTILVMLFLYAGINFFLRGGFFVSNIIIWIIVYFVVAYMKLYLVDISNNTWINFALFVGGLVGNIGIIVTTNILGLYIKFFNDKLLWWHSNCSPFIILMAIGLFNITRNAHIHGGMVGYISKLSFLIYIIHENLLLKTYYRPVMWKYVFKNMGNAHLLLWTFVIAIIVFVFGLVSSVIYKYTIQKCVTKAGDIIYPKMRYIYRKIEKVLLKLQ